MVIVGECIGQIADTASSRSTKEDSNLVIFLESERLWAEERERIRQEERASVQFDGQDFLNAELMRRNSGVENDGNIIILIFIAIFNLFIILCDSIIVLHVYKTFIFLIKNGSNLIETYNMSSKVVQ